MNHEHWRVLVLAVLFEGCQLSPKRINIYAIEMYGLPGRCYSNDSVLGYGTL